MNWYADSRNSGVMSHADFQYSVLQSLARWADAFVDFASNHFLLRRQKEIDVFLGAAEFDCRPCSLMLILVH
ncbi:unnamed protein product [Meloidogyne enterolobii]|uniref:Uncharacterized protein n=2 Tax=Meloidogyne enterolobii TaxID=390850 RepID=A0ACB0YWC0_MELEN